MLHDKDIRESLFDYLENYYGKIRILEEKNMGKSRADVVMVTERFLYGIEIKSDADTYSRLASQVKDYDRYYDYNIIAVGTSHALHVHEHIPDHWGIITVEEVEGKPDFYMFRKPSVNPNVTWKNKLRFLWRPELYKLQLLNGLPKYKDKSKVFVIDKIAEAVGKKIDEATLSAQMCEVLMERDYTKVEETLKEYRRGEIDKKLGAKMTPEEQVALIMRRNAAIENLKKARKGRRRRGKR